MSLSGATAGAMTGAQIGAPFGAYGLAIGGALGAIGGAIGTSKSKEERAVEDFYRQLSQGVSRKEAAMEKSIGEQKADAAEAQRRATQVARGGVSSAAGGVSGVAMQSNLQSQALAQRARSEAVGAQQKALADRDIQMKIAGAQGQAAIAAQKRLDKEKAMGIVTDYDWGKLGTGAKAPEGDLSLIQGAAAPVPAGG